PRLEHRSAIRRKRRQPESPCKEDDEAIGRDSSPLKTTLPIPRTISIGPSLRCAPTRRHSRNQHRLQDASCRSIPQSSFDYSLMMAGKTTVNTFGLRVLIGTIIFVVLIIC
ncbi:hypothetical protein HN51_064916, partial [Arachis hypogaea]